jgi:hypothetical protein
MGLEIRTTAVAGDHSAEGRLHLDSRSLSFQGTALKWSVDLGNAVRARADGDWLVVSRGRQKARFLVGKGVERWIEKIHNPPDRIRKFGARSGMKCWLSGGFPRDFVGELKNAGCSRTTRIDGCDLAFLRIDRREEMGLLESVLEELPAGINIWIVWPKGSAAISQSDVMTAARSAGYGPSKAAAYDESRSSMRFARKKGA